MNQTTTFTYRARRARWLRFLYAAPQEPKVLRLIPALLTPITDAAFRSIDERVRQALATSPAVGPWRNR